jgi:hypothetical protein
MQWLPFAWKFVRTQHHLRLWGTELSLPLALGTRHAGIVRRRRNSRRPASFFLTVWTDASAIVYSLRPLADIGNLCFRETEFRRRVATFISLKGWT